MEQWIPIDLYRSVERSIQTHTVRPDPQAVSQDSTPMDQHMPEFQKKRRSNQGELARLQRVMREAVIVDVRFGFCLVSLLAWKESTPMYQHMTEVENKSSSKTGEL